MAVPGPYLVSGVELGGGHPWGDGAEGARRPSRVAATDLLNLLDVTVFIVGGDGLRGLDALIVLEQRCNLQETRVTGVSARPATFPARACSLCALLRVRPWGWTASEHWTGSPCTSALRPGASPQWPGERPSPFVCGRCPE